MEKAPLLALLISLFGSTVHPSYRFYVYISSWTHCHIRNFWWMNPYCLQYLFSLLCGNICQAFSEICFIFKYRLQWNQLVCNIVIMMGCAIPWYFDTLRNPFIFHFMYLCLPPIIITYGIIFGVFFYLRRSRQVYKSSVVFFLFSSVI